MERIIVATTNSNKVKRIKNLLKTLNYEIVSLKDENITNIGEPEETANTNVGIAIEKALYYLNYVPNKTIVLSQDDTIQFEGVSEEDNPGVHIKKPVLEKYGEFTDELAAKYYTELANKYGGFIPMTFKYGHAVAIKKDDGRIVVKVLGAESELKVRLVNKINKLETVPGYFLSAIMEAQVDGKWVPYNELNEDAMRKLDDDLFKSITTLLKNI